jgi:hypothetical protein
MEQARVSGGNATCGERIQPTVEQSETPLNPVHAYRERINQVEALGVLGQDRREHARDNVSKFS